MRRFYYHFNKPASLQRKEPLMSVHYAGVCHIVRSVVCRVPCESHTQTRQPRVVMRGWARAVQVTDGDLAVIE